MKFTPKTFWRFFLYSGVSTSSVLVSLSIVATISSTMISWLASNGVVDIVGGSVVGRVSSCIVMLRSTRLTHYSYVSFVSMERSVWMMPLTGSFFV